MPAVETLKARNTSSPIEQRYIARVLKEEGAAIMRDQNRIISRYRVRESVPEITTRRFKVTGTSLEITHPLRQRFIDMRYRKGVRQKPVPIHNKVIYSHFNAIVNKMAYGLTEDVRSLIANESQIQM
ncbi:MAG: hypothetical protein AB3N16_15120 [Flavobacteriaceae bacterium]